MTDHITIKSSRTKFKFSLS